VSVPAALLCGAAGTYLDRALEPVGLAVAHHAERLAAQQLPEHVPSAFGIGAQRLRHLAQNRMAPSIAPSVGAAARACSSSLRSRRRSCSSSASLRRTTSGAWSPSAARSTSRSILASIVRFSLDLLGARALGEQLRHLDLGELRHGRERFGVEQRLDPPEHDALEHAPRHDDVLPADASLVRAVAAPALPVLRAEGRAADAALEEP
jgi:hypothetical protein